MSYLDPNVEEMERNILKKFFDDACAIQPLDSSISDNKIIRQTQSKLKVALSGSKFRCTCAKRSYGICEICQATSSDLYSLRIFFRMMKNAKKHGLTPEDMEHFLNNTKEAVNRS